MVRTGILSLLLMAPMAAAFVRRSLPVMSAQAPSKAGNSFSSAATNVAGALAEVWTAVNAAKDAETSTRISFPEVGQLKDAESFSAFLEHLEDCKDVCERFGSEIHAIGHFSADDGAEIELRVLGGSSDGDSGMFWESGEDDGWDDDWEIDTSLLEDDDTGAPADDAGDRLAPAAELTDDEIETLARDWVQAVVAGLGVCPFATSSSRAGLPLGDVSYPIDRAVSAEEIYESFWKEVRRLQQEDERALSTTLLITPEFCMANADAFDAFSVTITKALEPLALDEGGEGIQLVFFHPEYSFRDGADRMDDTDALAGNYARRSPHPMINILRTPQVRAAQRVIPTGAVYVQNQRTLGDIGIDSLEGMLRTGEWTGLEGKKVDRRQGLWKKAATVTAAVEAKGSREVVDELVDGDELGDLDVELPPAEAAPLPAAEEGQDAANAADVAEKPAAAPAEASAAPPAEAPPAPEAPAPRGDAFEAAIPEDVPSDFVAQKFKNIADGGDSGLSSEIREELAWMIELLQRRVSLSQGDMQTMRLTGAAKVTPENVERFIQSCCEIMKEAREYEAKQ